MKRLYLVRHAKAAQEAGGEDFKRSLVKTGRNDATKMARQLKKIADVPDLLISSSANRAFETAEIFAGAFGIKTKKIQSRKDIYDAGANAITAVLKELHAAVSSAMVVGHVPALNDLANSLLKNFKDEMPTAGIIAIDLNIEKWSELNEGVGSLVFFLYPALKQERAREGKEIRKSLQASIKTAVEKELQKVDAPSAEEMRSRVKKSVAQITKKFTKLLKAARKRQTRPQKEAVPSATETKSTTKTKATRQKK